MVSKIHCNFKNYQKTIACAFYLFYKTLIIGFTSFDSLSDRGRPHAGMMWHDRMTEAVEGDIRDTISNF
jgi:hypothetical protein